MADLIHVCGDPTADWLVVGAPKQTTSGLFASAGKGTPNVTVQAGGAALVTSLVTRLLPGQSANISGVVIPRELLHEPAGQTLTRTLSLWQPYESDGRGAYRIQEWLRYEKASRPDTCGTLYEGAELLVIDDSGLGFQEAWSPDRLRRRLPAQVLLKLVFYSAREQSRVLASLCDNDLQSRTTVVTSIDHLRTCTTRVGGSLSWEQMFEDVVVAVLAEESPFTRDGSLMVARVIITIGTAGAVVVEGDRSVLIFDRTGQEGDFERRLPGRVLGYNTCVLGALAASWVECEREPLDWGAAALTGLGLARALHLHGYEAHAEEEPGPSHLQFPYAALFDEYKHRHDRHRSGTGGVWDLSTFEAPNALALSGAAGVPWTILQEKVRGAERNAGRENGSGRSAGSDVGADDQAGEAVNAVLRRAHRIARLGPEKALQDVPLMTVGDWRSADRFETEGMRSVYNAMRGHLTRRPDKPLAVAVFGPPGAGKSYAIRQMAAQLRIPEKYQMTFNLSQFPGPEQLVVAFEQIRDCHLRQHVPLVFWDEFDAACEGEPLGWLKHFLAPLQDGEFMEHGRMHPIGGGIFVFAGGTCQTFDQFRSVCSSDDVSAKKPDFVSRLNAFVDVRGPNGSPNTIQDDLYVIRRALLLNGFLKRYAGHGLKSPATGYRVDTGVLNAFLRTTKFHHGARSMENLVLMSDLAEASVFAPSNLPPPHLMAMQVDAGEFNRLVRLGYREFLRVGITGHIGLDPAEDEALQRGIEQAVVEIQRQYPDRTLTVFSPLAKGADRRVARALLKCDGAVVIAVLPLPADDYIRDFGSTDDYHADREGADLRQEFRYWLQQRAVDVVVMEPSATRNEAYRKVGCYVAEHCDVLVAVWDGGEGFGEGSTAEVVAHYRQLVPSKPWWHVWAGNFRPEPGAATTVKQPGKVDYHPPER